MQKPIYITQETWNNLKWKEQDFIIFLREKRFTKRQIKRKLYITTDVWYWKLETKVKKKIEKDLLSFYDTNKVNKTNQSNWQKTNKE